MFKNKKKLHSSLATIKLKKTNWQHDEILPFSRVHAGYLSRNAHPRSKGRKVDGQSDHDRLERAPYVLQQIHQVLSNGRKGFQPKDEHNKVSNEPQKDQKDLHQLKARKIDTDGREKCVDKEL